MSPPIKRSMAAMEYAEKRKGSVSVLAERASRGVS
jgi:hypothetical protein